MGRESGGVIALCPLSLPSEGGLADQGAPGDGVGLQGRSWSWQALEKDLLPRGPQGPLPLPWAPHGFVMVRGRDEP